MRNAAELLDLIKEWAAVQRGPVNRFDYAETSPPLVVESEQLSKGTALRGRVSQEISRILASRQESRSAGEPVTDPATVRRRLIDITIEVLQEVTIELISDSVRDALNDPSAQRALLDIAFKAVLPAEIPDIDTPDAPVDGNDGGESFPWLIAGAAPLLLTSGVAIPLLLGTAVETILVNEIAAVTLIVTVASLRKS